MESPEVEILKSLWTRLPDGRFIIHTLNSVKLRPKSGFDSSYFQFETGFEMLTNTPPQNIHDLFSSFGSTDFILKQSILPVVSWVKGDDFIKCIGTAFLISCSGYVVTASHVLLDPQESGYKGAKIEGQTLRFDEDLMMGVLIPFNPASGNNGFRLLQFENAWYWGEWRESPLIHEDERFYGITDVAICKIPLEPHLGVFQPLAMSLEPFKKEETAYAIGYAEMKNILVRYNAQNEPINRQI